MKTFNIILSFRRYYGFYEQSIIFSYLFLNYILMIFHKFLFFNLFRENAREILKFRIFLCKNIKFDIFISY